MAMQSSRGLSQNSRSSTNSNQLQVSGDTSGTIFGVWTVFTQSIDGMYKRHFEYDCTPTLAGSTVSGAPQMSFNYLEGNFTVTTKSEFVEAPYASGFSQNLALEYISDSETGGYGQKGVISPLTVGMLRKQWDEEDNEFTCTSEFNVVMGKQPGEYDAVLDSSGSINGDFFANVIIPASQKCTKFKTSLLDI